MLKAVKQYVKRWKSAEQKEMEALLARKENAISELKKMEQFLQSEFSRFFQIPLNGDICIAQEPSEVYHKFYKFYSKTFRPVRIPIELVDQIPWSVDSFFYHNYKKHKISRWALEVVQKAYNPLDHLDVSDPFSYQISKRKIMAKVKQVYDEHFVHESLNLSANVHKIFAEAERQVDLVSLLAEFEKPKIDEREIAQFAKEYFEYDWMQHVYIWDIVRLNPAIKTTSVDIKRYMGSSESSVWSRCITLPNKLLQQEGKITSMRSGKSVVEFDREYVIPNNCLKPVRRINNPFDVAFTNYGNYQHEISYNPIWHGHFGLHQSRSKALIALDLALEVFKI